MADDPAELVERRMREGIEKAQERQQRIRGLSPNKAAVSPAKIRSRYSSDGFFSEPGYSDPNDRTRPPYKGGVLQERLGGRQITSMSTKSGLAIGESAPDRSELLAATRTSTSIGDSTIDGLRPWKYDNSAVPNPQDISGRHGPRPNPHFGVFQRLYEEAFKEPNHAEKVWEKKVKSKVIGPQWVPNCGSKSMRTGSSVGYA